jgi:NADPH-dependent 2,4-dienoyl-CoA reductase/sulfur reductase-like enzyme
MGERLVVVGADAAGMTAASQARRRNRDLEVVAFERTGIASYSACGEPYYISGEVDTLDELIARTPEQFAKAGIEVRLHTEVVKIDTERSVVSVRNGDSGDITESGYDQLLVATGARAAVPPIDGIDLDGVHVLRTLDDAEALRRVADAGEGNIVIVGGGYIGVEVAEAFETQGWNVTVLEALPSLMSRTIDGDLGPAITEAMEEVGVRVLTNEVCENIEGSGHVTSVFAAGERIPADVVVLATGARPVVELADDAGIELGATGAIAVDDHQRTSVDGVWSAGDCAEARHRVTDEMVNLQLGTVANKAGRIAGINIAGGDATFPGVLGTAVTRFHDLQVAVTGVRLEQATASGIDAVDATVSGITASHYMPDASKMTIRITAERGTSRILGAQIIGGPGAGKRIDVLATAIWQEMQASELEWVDLAYAPPFSAVWDTVAIAARKAAAASVR